MRLILISISALVGAVFRLEIPICSPRKVSQWRCNRPEQTVFHKRSTLTGGSTTPAAIKYSTGTKWSLEVLFWGHLDIYCKRLTTKSHSLSVLSSRESAWLLFQVLVQLSKTWHSLPLVRWQQAQLSHHAQSLEAWGTFSLFPVNPSHDIFCLHWKQVFFCLNIYSSLRKDDWFVFKRKILAVNFLQECKKFLGAMTYRENTRRNMESIFISKMHSMYEIAKK